MGEKEKQKRLRRRAGRREEKGFVENSRETERERERDRDGVGAHEEIAASESSGDPTRDLTKSTTRCEDLATVHTSTSGEEGSQAHSHLLWRREDRASSAAPWP